MQMIETMTTLKMNQLQAFIRLSNNADWCYTYSKR